MASSLFLGGILNIQDPIFGLQLYYYLFVLILVIAVVTWVLWYYSAWKPFTPLHGLYHAYKAGSNAAFIFDSPLHGEMVSEAAAKCIFDYSKYDFDLSALNYIRSKLFYYPTVFLDDIDFVHGLVYKFGGVNRDVLIAKKLQGGEWDRSPSVNCGGVDVDIVIDTDNWTIRSSPQHRAIERCASLWNETNPDDQIHSYSKFQRKLLEGKIECPEVKKETWVDWTRIDKGFTTNMEASEYIGKKIQMAEMEFNKDEAMKNRLALYVLLAGVGLAVMITAIRLITHYY
jgi:hypothetical protein